MRHTELCILKLYSTQLGSEAAALTKLLPESRMRKLERYRFEKDKKVCLYSYLLAVSMIMRNCGDTGRIPEFTVNAYGKPALSSGKCFFNLSHSGTAIACGCSLQGEIGVDIEEVGRPFSTVMRKCFTDDELVATDGIPQDKLCAFFYRTWTRKEAYLKYCGTGIDRRLNTINTLSDGEHYVYDTFEGESFVCTVCSERHEPIRLSILDEIRLKEELQRGGIL